MSTMSGLFEAEHHAPLQRVGRVVEVHDRPRGVLDRLVRALDQLLAALRQHLDRHVVGDQVVLDELAHEVEIGLARRREADLDLLEAHLHQGVEHVALAHRVHRVDQGLVAVAEVDRAPQRGGVDDAVGPRAVAELDRDVRLVLAERHRTDGDVGWWHGRESPREAGRWADDIPGWRGSKNRKPPGRGSWRGAGERDESTLALRKQEEVGALHDAMDATAPSDRRATPKARTRRPIPVACVAPCQMLLIGGVPPAAGDRAGTPTEPLRRSPPTVIARSALGPPTSPLRRPCLPSTRRPVSPRSAYPSASTPGWPRWDSPSRS